MSRRRITLPGEKPRLPPSSGQEGDNDDVNRFLLGLSDTDLLRFIDYEGSMRTRGEIPTAERKATFLLIERLYNKIYEMEEEHNYIIDIVRNLQRDNAKILRRK